MLKFKHELQHELRKKSEKSKNSYRGDINIINKMSRRHTHRKAGNNMVMNVNTCGDCLNKDGLSSPYS